MLAFMRRGSSVGETRKQVASQLNAFSKQPRGISDVYTAAINVACALLAILNCMR
jgi:hypothetical protein